MFSERAPDFRQVEINDVTEFALRVVGDADGHDVSIGIAGDILVILGVLKMRRDLRHGALRESG